LKASTAAGWINTSRRRWAFLEKRKGAKLAKAAKGEPTYFSIHCALGAFAP